LEKKEEEIDENKIDEMEYMDHNKKNRFVNIKIMGNIDDYKVTLEKKTI